MAIQLSCLCKNKNSDMWSCGFWSSCNTVLGSTAGNTKLHELHADPFLICCKPTSESSDHQRWSPKYSLHHSIVLVCYDPFKYITPFQIPLSGEFWALTLMLSVAFRKERPQSSILILVSTWVKTLKNSPGGWFLTWWCFFKIFRWPDPFLVATSESFQRECTAFYPCICFQASMYKMQNENWPAKIPAFLKYCFLRDTYNHGWIF